MKIRPASEQHLYNLTLAIRDLRRVRDCLKLADCPKTLRRVRMALTSAGGAARHMQHRVMETKGRSP